MSRSVSVPYGASAVAYRAFDGEDEWAFKDLLDWIRIEAETAWPSMGPCDRWVGREDHALLENRFATIGISEYMGLVAVWLLPLDDCEQPGLRDSWVATVEQKFHKIFGQYQHVATFSNGEAVYEKIQHEEVQP